MDCKRSNANPCMYLKWSARGLLVWLPWIDDCMVWGDKEQVMIEKKMFMDQFECEDIGDVDEYVGCK